MIADKGWKQEVKVKTAAFNASLKGVPIRMQRQELNVVFLPMEAVLEVLIVHFVEKIRKIETADTATHVTERLQKLGDLVERKTYQTLWRKKEKGAGFLDGLIRYIGLN